MKTQKINTEQRDILIDLQAVRAAKNAAIKLEKELTAKARCEIPELKDGEIALTFNGNVIATQQVSQRSAVSVELLKLNFPDVAEQVTVTSEIQTLRITA